MFLRVLPVSTIGGWFYLLVWFVSLRALLPSISFIVRLRRYIEKDPTKPRHLLTVRGVGYRFVAAPASEE